MMTLLDFAIKTVLEAGELVTGYYEKKDLVIGTKTSHKDLVTEADKACEKLIFESVQTAYPEHGIIGEEGASANPNAEYIWIVDPIDGTTNFAHSLPIFAVSAGILKNGKPFIGVIFNPITGELFFAQRGSGAFKKLLHISDESKKIHVSGADVLRKSMLSTGFNANHPDSVTKNYPIFGKSLHETQAMRRLGAATIDICYTACGYFDGFWEFNLKPWDVAAGIVILEEAGGKVTNILGENYDVMSDTTIVVSNGLIHEKIVAMLG